ncbi:MAG: hypothetical protein QNJ46_08605 [Leptolyngbyaceae cyanobacterium MO_188.B28]|nr:hypothetical protein [Leptolyngbyaceae cyanobacterium MO_188.B28]
MATVFVLLSPRLEHLLMRSVVRVIVLRQVLQLRQVVYTTWKVMSREK